MNEVSINIENSLSDGEKQLIVQSLIKYNDTQATPEAARNLSVVSRSDGKIVGGLLGFTHWNWLYVKHLWVAEDHRGRGLGRGLMLSAEREACTRNCTNAHCDTFDFQALPFYQKLGYTVFGTLDDYPPGHVRYFLHKRDLLKHVA